ncbi:hypothetical protein R5R35_001077 [Gryllus longicercus]|uniref:BTB domain-containing protein n=1 Tax=Gryllus longicercus TaxID=2509291 RepID=A0AAN9ZDL8_9ORTH
MADRILCVSWNDHANEVAREWKSFLENNSFVDCTIAAEGKSLKAHRLILSACSPYFHMLFKEQNEKHPIVFLRDTSYHTLKSLIDFVYNGKVEIPAGQLEIFLELAVSLQINGLHTSFRNDRRINILDNAAEERSQCLSRINRDNSGVSNWRTSNENCFSNSSCQSHYQFLQDTTNSTQIAPPILFEGCDDSAEVVQSRAAMMAVQNHPVHDNPEVLVSTEQSLKQEHLFSEIKILETRSEELDGVNHIESMPGNPEDEMNAMMAVQNHPVHDNPEVLVSTEQSLKQENLFSEIKILETRSEELDGVNHIESMPGNPEDEMNAMMAVQNHPVHDIPEVLVSTEQSLKQEHLFSEIKILEMRSEVLDGFKQIESMPGNPEDEMNAMMAVQNHPVHDNPEVLVSTEQSLKQEHLFSEIKILETRSEVLDGVNHIESMLGNPKDEMNHGCALAFEENLGQFSRSRESLHSNVNSALMILQQEQQRQQQHQEKQLQLQQEVNEQQLQQTDEQQQPVTHSACELSLAPDLTEQNDQSLPELSMPLSDEADASESEESTNALDVPGNDTEEMAKETELAHDKSLNPSSGE